MPCSLDDKARRTHFIVVSGKFIQKMSFPRDWNFTFPTSPEQLYHSVLSASQSGVPAVVLVEESEYLKVHGALRTRNRDISFGMVVVASKVDFFFREGYLLKELIDVVDEKEFKKNTEFHLLRSVHQYGAHRITETLPRIGQRTLYQLNDMFIELSAERNSKKLLSMILLKAIHLVDAEGGSLYMLEEHDGELVFKARVSSEDNLNLTMVPLDMSVSESSLCGYVALTAKALKVPNVHQLPALLLPQFNRSQDHFFKERTLSLIAVPLRNSRNELIGVLELVNKHSSEATPMKAPIAFDEDDESLLQSFCTQAATCIETVDLYGDIQSLFEGFVRASITAIESRDPSTGGHSERVASMSVALARATTECEVGIYRSVRFREEEIRELEYAALLHDFGKIGVREQVLVKAKKLYPYQLENIRGRLKLSKAVARVTCLEKKIQFSDKKDLWEGEYQSRIQQIEKYWDLIVAANEPTVLPREGAEMLGRIRLEQIPIPDGSLSPILTPEEFQALSVDQGSLTDSERLEIESHVRHTYQFLKMIPWTKDFKHLTEIAYCHHEKLDGTGYPRGLTNHEIPLQSKIMTIADIFDALTAADRWYKEAVPTEKAISILAQEVTQGQLDPVLFELFVERRVYDAVSPKTRVA